MKMNTGDRKLVSIDNQAIALSFRRRPNCELEKRRRAGSLSAEDRTQTQPNAISAVLSTAMRTTSLSGATADWGASVEKAGGVQLLERSGLEPGFLENVPLRLSLDLFVGLASRGGPEAERGAVSKYEGGGWMSDHISCSEMGAIERQVLPRITGFP